MFNYTTTTILNSNLDSSGLTKVTGSTAGLKVLRVNNFLKDGIVSVYKRPYAAGVKEIASVTVPTITSGLVARLVIDIRLSQQTDSEYANTYLYFKKPVVVEVLATGTAATDAAALIAAVNELKTEFGFGYVVASSGGGAVITLTAINNNQRFWSVTIDKEVASTNSLIQPEYELVATGTVGTAGKVGFGDDEYMIRSIMFPTYENTRHFGTNKEERPIAGGNYSQYTLRYSIAKNTDMNLGITGMADRSITNHVFYVKSDVVSAFESALNAVGITGAVLLQASFTATGGILSTGADATDQITVVGNVGAVTYATTDSTKIAVGATTGLVTTAGKTATGAATVTVTDAVGNTDTVVYDIQA